MVGATEFEGRFVAGFDANGSKNSILSMDLCRARGDVDTGASTARPKCDAGCLGIVLSGSSYTDADHIRGIHLARLVCPVAWITVSLDRDPILDTDAVAPSYRSEYLPAADDLWRSVRVHTRSGCFAHGVPVGRRVRRVCDRASSSSVKIGFEVRLAWR